MTLSDHLNVCVFKFVEETAAKTGSDAGPSGEVQQELSKAQEELSKAKEELSRSAEEVQKKQEEVSWHSFTAVMNTSLLSYVLQSTDLWFFKSQSTLTLR